ncbi:hypothetical protein [Singulisphaera sp. PoT]|uniref:hypothetical protein n=1 Tax=Singulisphaera sp. PoT TaxID=3411797 RepID=UPI003BF55AED
MKRISRPAFLLAASLIGSIGCTEEPSPLSPIADLHPERTAVANREMAEVARKNREAEAAFYRKLRSTPPANTDANPPAGPDARVAGSPSSNHTADTREKP